MLINSAFADSTSDARIQAYKANRLLSQELILPTSTGAKDSDEVVCFNPGKLTWNSDTAGNAVLAGLSGKYSEWTLDEFRLAFGSEYDWAFPTTEHNDMRDYLSAIVQGKIESDSLTKEEAKTYLEEQFSFLDACCALHSVKFPCYGLDLNRGDNITGDWRACEGMTFDQFKKLVNQTGAGNSITCPEIQLTGEEDFSTVNRDVNSDADFTRLKGLTATQILQGGSGAFSRANLPVVTFNGDEDFSGKDLSGLYLHNAVGITGAQIASASNIEGTMLPAINFNGTESFSGKSLNSTNFTNCTGLTATQLLGASSLQYTCLTDAQYNAFKDTLHAKFAGTYVFIPEYEEFREL